MAVVAASPSGWSAHPLVTDDTGTQGTGHWQMEVTSDHMRTSDASARITERTNGITLTYGWRESTDVALTTPHLSRRDTSISDGQRKSGLGDLGLVVKHRYLEQENLQLGLKASLTLPSGNAEAGLGKTTGTQTLTHLIARGGEWGTSLLNMGVIHNGDGRVIPGERSWLWAASFAWLTSPMEGLSFAFDFGAQQQAVRGQRQNPAYALLGLIWPVRPATDLDVGVKQRLNEAENKQTVSIGLTQRW